MRKKGEIIVAACIVAVAAVLFVAAQFINTGAAMARGGDFMPKIAATLLLILGIVRLIQALRIKETEAEKKIEAESASGLNYRALFLSIVLLGAYILLLAPVGFLITTTVYVTAQMYLYAPGEKRFLYLCPIVGVVSSAIIYYAFVHGFELLLPAGIFG